ncbi:DUF4974 domain-containing protein [Cytophagaceae bacterium YF14B1]|uniref:DUF4974 domain-containing protein n=1 Tax=Xanthocytophaga flava TaxID=3048013 RepID=A0AAE3U6K1_9BACT|nr:FecR domain-containing protein [Xanthocytophaga flavus]MDJ1480662.1 DUF4974 domain-containing protein [Xanthocytophaga flavus]
MNRDNFKQLLDKFLAGKTNPAEEQLLFDVYEEFQKDSIPLDTNLTQEENQKIIKEILFAEQEPESKPLTPAISFRLRIAASIGLLLACTLVTWIGRSKWLAIIDPVHTITVLTKPGEKKKVKLPDNTWVWLNSGSSLSYPDVFRDSLRIVRLSGEAHFDVTHNADQPFIVETNQLSVRVLGTVFNVKAYAKDKKTETALIRGSVLVKVHDLPNRKVVLHPSEKLVVYPKMKMDTGSDSTLQLEKINHTESANSVVETDWTQNRLSFTNESFEQIAADMERWYGVKITFENEEIKQSRFTGSVSSRTSLWTVLETLKLTRQFSYKKMKDNLLHIY